MKSNEVDQNIKAYMQLKIELLKLAKCIDDCIEEKDREYYRMEVLHYSNKLKKLKESIEETYGLKICQCCFLSNDEKNEPLPPTFHVEVGVSYHSIKEASTRKNAVFFGSIGVSEAFSTDSVSNIGRSPMGRSNPSTTSCLGNP